MLYADGQRRQARDVASVLGIENAHRPDGRGDAGARRQHRRERRVRRPRSWSSSAPIRLRDLTRLAIAVFVLLIGATFAAFFAAQRVKGEPPVAQVIGLDRHFSPNGDDRKDINRFRVRLREQGEVSIDVVDDDGDAVRRLADGDSVGPGRPLRLTWDGRTDAGRLVPDGPYRVRVTLRREARSVVPPRTMFVDTEPPRPRVREILPEQIVGPAPGTMTFRLGAVSRRVAARVRIFRTDGGDPVEVASLRVPVGSRAVDWNGLVDGRPAPPGTYLVQVTTRDVAGNRGSTPVDVPPQPGEARGKQGFTVRAIAAQMPMRPVTAGERLTVNVDSRRRPYRWSLRRAGRTNPVLQRRQRAGDPTRFRAPEGDSGLYLLELEAGAARTSVAGPRAVDRARADAGRGAERHLERHRRGRRGLRRRAGHARDRARDQLAARAARRPAGRPDRPRRAAAACSSTAPGSATTSRATST